MSWKSMDSPTTSEQPTTSATRSSRSSGTSTTATFGSIVVNGWPPVSAPAAVSALNRVDLPALGSPTIPIFIATPRSPQSTRPSGSARPRAMPSRAPPSTSEG